MALKQDGVRFVLCPKQGIKIEGVVLNPGRILGFFCSKQGQGFKPSQRLNYIPILVDPPPPRPRGSRTANVAQDVHIKCCSIYLATLGAGVASSGQAIRQFRNEQETGPELTFAKTSGTVTMEEGGGGGGSLAKRLSLLRCSCFQILISNHF